jgi:hypothetical protein
MQRPGLKYVADMNSTDIYHLSYCQMILFGVKEPWALKVQNKCKIRVLIDVA